ncbi:(2Fe-2S)-binding protein [Lentibacillus sp. CBA3610]|uniref:(2Fe-2S)-binding protein n=1 Tax=Lentibacillus sp. CBA3610 TaxID=2518176 RepID=UPI0015957A80|nr:(2Fe-2S)-binding protein [Lentibacillus sp. CBA3610]QKY70214.1 (2Fe-2S)-binding protein [Lentibacillus sp. CBA3610]
MDQSTIVCRCEEINIDEIETAIKMGAETFDDIKRLTRCGMGPCQAKVCMNLVRQLIYDYAGKPLSDIPPARLRMPLKVTRMETLASNDSPSSSSSVISVFNESASNQGGDIREK